VVVDGGFVVGGAVAGGLVAGGLVAGGLVAGGAEDGGGATIVAAGVLAWAGGDVPAGVVAVVPWAGTVVVAFAGAEGDEGAMVEGAVVDDELGRVDRVVGVLAPDDAQAASARPPATTIASDLTMRVIRILLLAHGLSRRPVSWRSTLRSKMSTDGGTDPFRWIATSRRFLVAPG